MVFSGGSNRVAGSQIDGGRTVRSSMNSSTPSSKSCRVVALYATSQNTYMETHRESTVSVCMFVNVINLGIDTLKATHRGVPDQGEGRLTFMAILLLICMNLLWKCGLIILRIVGYIYEELDKPSLILLKSFIDSLLIQRKNTLYC